MRAAGATPTLAIGSTLPAVLPSAVAGSFRYARAGLVDWRVGLTTGGAGALFAVAGAIASSQVDARLLMVACSVILGASGVGLLRSYRRSATGPDAAGRPVTSGHPPPSIAALAAVGAVSGFVAGLLGLGGGLIVVPAFTRLLRMPLRTAIGSSLVAVAMLSVPAVVAHSLFGQVDWLARAGPDRRGRPGRPPRLAARRHRLGGDRRHGVRRRARGAGRGAGDHRGLVAPRLNPP